MIKRGIYSLTAGGLALILAACGSNDMNKGKPEVTSEENLTEARPDAVTEENLEYYFCQSGSGSLCERFAVYTYKGEFIFVADYFNCGNELSETRPLSEEESKLFLDEANAVFSEGKDKKSSMRGDKAGGENEDGDGAYAEKTVLVTEGIAYSVSGMDFEAMGISVTNARDAEYPSEEETERYKIEGILELQESEQWKERVVSIGGREFQRSVGEQMEERSGEKIVKMVIDELLDEDFVIKAETQKGDSYKVTVTYSGYVAEVEKE